MSADRFAELIGLPSPIAFESPNSWICRAALNQGIGPRALREYLGWPTGGDLDLEFAKMYANGFASDARHLGNLEIARRVLTGVLESSCATDKFLLGQGHKAR